MGAEGPEAEPAAQSPPAHPSQAGVGRSRARVPGEWQEQSWGRDPVSRGRPALHGLSLQVARGAGPPGPLPAPCVWTLVVVLTYSQCLA